MDKLIEEKIDYLHFSYVNVASQKPLDATFSVEPITAVLCNYVNGRVPVFVAGGVSAPSIAEQALDYGASMVALGRTLIINPNWVELVENGEEDKLTSFLKLDTLEEIKIPATLMAIFEALEGWVIVE